MKKHALIPSAWLALAMLIGAISIAAQTRPPYGMNAVYDEHRGETIYFGGYDYSPGPLAETWRFDGTNFVKLAPANNPSTNEFHSMTYDSVLQRVVLVVGSDNNNVWLWDGTNWQAQNPATRPPPRERLALGYDQAHNQIILYGESDPSALTDTWLWNATNWINLNPPNFPSPTGAPGPGNGGDGRCMVFDEARNELVLLGGMLQSQVFETWVWKGTNWEQRFPAHSPGAQGYGAAAYDRLRQEIVLFAGYTFLAGHDVVSNETWTWNGTDWQQKFPATVPAARTSPNMVFDAARGLIVMQGGNNAGQLEKEAWVWNGNNWKLFDDPRPPIQWIGGSGDWSDTSHWSGGVLPGPDDDVLIDQPSIAVSHSTGTHAIKSLTTRVPFTLSGGTLSVARTLQINSTFILSGGRIAGGTINVIAPATFSADGNGNNRLSGLTLNGALSLAFESRLGVSGTLVNNGTITLSGQGATLFFDDGGPQSLLGNGSVVFVGVDTKYLSVEGNTQLTIGPGMTVRGQRGTIGQNRFTGGIYTLDNQGTISADTFDAANTGLVINPTTFTNHGLMEARNGGILDVMNLLVSSGTVRVEAASALGLAGAWSNTGVIQIDGGSFYQNGNVTTAGLGTIQRSGGNFYLHRGVLDNTGNVVTLDATTGPWILSGGRISGGTINVVAPATFSADGNGNNRLSGLTFNGALSLAFDSRLGVSGTLINNGTITLSGQGATLFFDDGGPQSLLGNGSVVFVGVDPKYLSVEGNTQLTIGPGMTIRGQRATIGQARFTGGIYTLNNQGTISADTFDAANTGFVISPTAFTNHGLIEARNGDILDVSNFASNDGLVNASTAGAVKINQNILNAPNGALRSDSTSSVSITGYLTGNTTNRAQFSFDGTLQMVGGAASSPLQFETAGLDFGRVSRGWDGNFSLGRLTLGNNSFVKLVDNSRNSAGSGIEALYVDSLTVPAGATLDLNGLHLYAQTSSVSGNIINGQIILGPQNNEIIPRIPIRVEIFDVGSSEAWTFNAKAGQTISILVDPSKGKSLRPALGFADVQLFDPALTLLGHGSSASQNQLVIFSSTAPSDGLYTVLIRATSDHSDEVGGYELTVRTTAPNANSWPMRQRDGQNTGRADFTVPADRLGPNFFGTLKWQTPSPNSPTDGAFGAGGMTYFDDVGPGGSDILVGTYHSPKGIQGMDRHTGKTFWFGNPDGGERIADMAPAFSPDGNTIYIINDANPNPMMAFNPVSGPSVFWHNGLDADPQKLASSNPKISPDGRIFSGSAGFIRAGSDFGDRISVTWDAAKSTCVFLNNPAFYVLNNRLQVISASGCGQIYAFDGLTGAVLWQTETDSIVGSDGDPTIDPANGNTYVALGNSSIFVVGVDANGLALWNPVTKPVYTYQAGVNHQQRAISSGCLSHDGLTYYFQTVSQEGDGRLYAINTSNGSVKWSYNTASKGWQEPCAAPIITQNGVLIVGNNHGGTYFAIQDAGSHGQLLATLPVEAPGEALFTAALSAEGDLYLPARIQWAKGNGNGDLPTQQTANIFNDFDLTSPASGLNERTLRLSSVFTTSDSQVVVPVFLDGTGAENGFNFSVGYDPALLQFNEFAPSAYVPGINTHTSSGSAGLLLTHSVAAPSIPAGTIKLGELHFTPLAPSFSTSVEFRDSPDARQILNAGSIALPATYIGGHISVSRRGLQVGTNFTAQAGQAIISNWDPPIEYMEVVRPGGSDPYLYWDTKDNIFRSKLDGSQIETIFSSPQIGGGIAFDPVTQRLYTGSRAKLFSINLDGSDPVDVTTTRDPLLDVELDVQNRKIYWTEEGVGRSAVFRANLDGTQKEIIRELGDGSEDIGVDGIALDVANGKLYLSAANFDGGWIERMGLDGSNPTVINRWPVPRADLAELEIDLVRRKVYVNRSAGIFESNLDENGPLPQKLTVPAKNGFYFDPINNSFYTTEGTEITRTDLGGEVSVPITFIGSGIEHSWNFTLLYFKGTFEFSELKKVPNTSASANFVALPLSDQDSVQISVSLDPGT